MIKFFKNILTKIEKNRIRLLGIIGKNEEGDDMAHADYINAGGIAHIPTKNEVSVLLEMHGAIYNTVFGQKSQNAVQNMLSGESRLFSNDDMDEIKAYIDAKIDGKIYLNGNLYSAVLFEPLKEYLDTLKIWLNTHTHPSPMGTTAVPTNPFTGDAIKAKSQKVNLS